MAENIEVLKKDGGYIDLEEVSEKVLKSGVVIIRDYIAVDESIVLRRAIRNWLIPSTPLRASRVLAETLLGRENTPNVLQRRPFSAQRKQWKHMGATVFAATQALDELNRGMFNEEEILDAYGQKPRTLNTAVFNRFAPGEEFEKHQDAITNEGLSFVFQTSPTLWKVHPEGPRQGREYIEFFTYAGDLIIQTQSSGQSQDYQTGRHAGFNDFNMDGSVIHSGLDLSEMNRFTLALFSQNAQR